MRINKIVCLEYILSCLIINFIFVVHLTASQPEGLIYIRAKRIYTCDHNRVIDKGGILIKGDKIIKVERKAKPPRKAKFIDLKDKVIIPGLIDAHSHIGFHREDFNIQTEPETWRPFLPPDFGFFATKKEPLPAKVEVRYQAAQAVFYGDKSFKRFLAEGITSAKIAIPTDELVGGISACVKLAAQSPSEFILKNPAGVDFCFIKEENVMERYGDLKKVFLEAIEYRKKFEKYMKDLKNYKEKGKTSEKELKEPKRPKRDENKEVILQILDKKLPAFIWASRINEIQAAIKINEEFMIRLILVKGHEAYKVADKLSLNRIPVLAGPEVVLNKGGHGINYIRELLNMNVPVGFCSGSGIGPIFLPFQMTYAIQHGMTKIEALNILTINTAKILGVSNRIGSIAEGKDADFVVLNKDPFELDTKAERVYVDGRLAYSEE